MLRKIGMCAAAVLLLTGCSERGAYSTIGRLSSALVMKDKIEGVPQVFSYTHSLGLVVPHGEITPRFEKAREACLHQADLACSLLSANSSSNSWGDDATLVVTLPHGKIATFEKQLTGAGVIVQSRSSAAENVGAQARDNEHKLAQLTAYRDKLAAMAKAKDLSIDDLIKVESELTRIEADLDAALAVKRDISERLAKESLTVSFGESQAALAPISRAFTGAGDALVESTAAVIDFVIRIVPWLPIIAGAVFLLRWLWFFVRRKRAE
ncbi:MAG: DUF4349 domain-containing protein [Rhizomicrobium sp.]|nr:DUF4349 domain-containing protein [Rhizomicrobium sp.]